MNNTRIQTPWTDNLNGINIGNVGLYTVVITDFGMIVKFDGNHHLEVVLPDGYFSKVSSKGLCITRYHSTENDVYNM